MKHISFIIILVLALTGCVSFEDKSNLPETKDPTREALITPENPPDKEYLQSNCEFDSVAFALQMGKGLLWLRNDAFPLILYGRPKPTTTGGIAVIRDSNGSKEIIVDGKPAGYFTWYSYPDEYTDGTIMRKGGSKKEGAIEISIHPNDGNYWLIRDSTSADQWKVKI